MRIIAGDVGGTKTWLQLREFSEGAWHVRLEERYDSTSYATFDAMLKEFHALVPGPVSTVCFAVAGPVVARIAHVTNLAWTIDADEIARSYSIPRVILVNDFYAVAAGVPLLHDADLVTIHQAERDLTFPVAILGAGTGLGEAVVIPTVSGWRVVPGEGGHADFAPADVTQLRLFEALSREYGHVSYERLLSGQGLVSIFQFLRGEAFRENGQTPSEVAMLADKGDATAVKAFEIFVDVYGAEAGNMALRVLARGGVYLAGGIAAKNISRFTDGRFFRSFSSKGRLGHLLPHMRVDIITNQQVGLLGAADIAIREASSM
jgi:glucokinase